MERRAPGHDARNRNDFTGGRSFGWKPVGRAASVEYVTSEEGQGVGDVAARGGASAACSLARTTAPVIAVN